MKYYRPLPNNLTIKKSNIEGIGLFATKDISKGTCLGLSHIFNENFQDSYIRLPLGGFINYNKTPNTETDTVFEGQVYDTNSKDLYLWTVKDIKTGEELTLKYFMYDPTK